MISYTLQQKYMYGKNLKSVWSSISIKECHPLVIMVMMTSSYWKHFPRYWPFVPGIHQSQVNAPHKGQWRRALVFSLICAWTNGWVNKNRDVGDLRCRHAHYDVTVMIGLDC